ncbi:tetratricopeptide repeat protein [Streptomyces sp. BK239]|uniref:J domain-containing protein n=1 Tax=Streptomyces sp. BK239 TaxID=2512155 RepID=UPI00102CF5F3|nr:tetratricopeptide repeat protein [Streptomyces sp. BK239]RZU12914.1 tetratricopeptide repeat protein [Streptomyces sp. BK239]
MTPDGTLDGHDRHDALPDYYEEFDIPRSATADQIGGLLDKAFRKWSSRASRAPDAAKRREAEDKVALITRSRGELLDPDRRRAYDRALDRARRPAGPTQARPTPARQAPVTRPGQQPPQRVRDWLGHARTLVSRNDLTGALYELRQAVHHDDGDAEAWQLLGIVHATQGELSSAVQEFRRALALRPGDAFTHTLIARVHERHGDHGTAADWHLAAARLAPADVTSYIAAADNLYRARRYDESLSAYEQALRLRPGDTDLRDQIARIWSLRAEGAMAWHPGRRRYTVASPDGASTVRHCVEQALAVGVSDLALAGLLHVYRTEAARAFARTWRWTGPMAPVIAVCLALSFALPSPFDVVALAALFGLPIVMGVKPRWRHAYRGLPPQLRPQIRRVP